MKYIVAMLCIFLLLVGAVGARGETYEEFMNSPYITEEAKAKVSTMNIPDRSDISSILSSISKQKREEMKTASKIDIKNSIVIRKNNENRIVSKSEINPKFKLENGKIIITKDFENKKYNIVSRKTKEIIEYYPDEIGTTLTLTNNLDNSVDIRDGNVNYSIVTGIEKIATEEEIEKANENRISRRGSKVWSSNIFSVWY